MNGNYIKLNRKILEWEWWDDINTCRLFLYMLLKANWKAGKYMGRDIARGSFVSSISKLSEDTKLTVDEVRTAIKHLKSTGEITSKSYNKFTVFTIKNYDLYQDFPEQVPNKSQANPEQIPSSSQAIPELFPTIEEGKKERKEEGKNRKKKDTDVSSEKVYYPNDTLLDASLKEYIVYRKEIKKPMTEKAVELLMKKLSAYDNDTAIAMLHQSIENGWQGVFPLKETKPGGNPSGNHFNDDMRRWADQYDSTGVYNNRNGD